MLLQKILSQQGIHALNFPDKFCIRALARSLPLSSLMEQTIIDRPFLPFARDVFSIEEYGIFSGRTK